MGIGLGASPVLDSPMISFFSVSVFSMNHLLVCFSCFLAHFEGWRWNRWAKWERTAPNSSKETGKAQVHAWGKSPGTASPLAWSLESMSFCYFLPFLLLLSCRPGSVSPSSIRVAPAFPGVLNSWIVLYFSFSSPQTYFSPLFLCSKGFLYHPSLVWWKAPSNLPVRSFGIAGCLLPGRSWVTDQRGRSTTEETHSASLLNAD